MLMNFLTDGGSEVLVSYVSVFAQNLKCTILVLTTYKWVFYFGIEAAYHEMEVQFSVSTKVDPSHSKPSLVGTEPGTNRSWLLIPSQPVQLVGIAATDSPPVAPARC